jgi:predicted porin
MKKSLIALAVLAASGASFAQSSVTLYGIADVYLGRTTATDTPSQVGITNGGISGSRFGFKGSEDLGGGLKANFLLEQGFGLDTGAATAGQGFSRQSYVGFSGGFGEVKLGKMWSAYDDISGAANASFDSVFAPVSNVWLSTNYNANPSNGVYYASPSMSGFSGAASYAFGENKGTSVDATYVSAIHVKYEAGPLFAALAFQKETAQNGATTALTSNNFTRLNATYDLGVAKALVGFGRVEAGDNTTNEWSLGADVPVNAALTVSGGIARSTDNFAGDAVRKGYGLAASYALSKRTNVYTGYQSSTKTLAGKDTDMSTLGLGVKHTF